MDRRQGKEEKGNVGLTTPPPPPTPFSAYILYSIYKTWGEVTCPLIIVRDGIVRSLSEMISALDLKHNMWCKENISPLSKHPISKTLLHLCKKQA